MVGYVYAQLGTRMILFGLAPAGRDDFSAKRRQMIVADANGMGYTHAYYSDLPMNVTNRSGK